MTTIVISVLPDGMPVDKMEEEDGSICPLPTKDEDLNQENKDVAIAEYNYGPAITDAECGNCGMYNQTDDMMDCIGDASGGTGYCQMLKFVCSSENTCNEWAKGGPITSDLQEEYRDNL